MPFPALPRFAALAFSCAAVLPAFAADRPAVLPDTKAEVREALKGPQVGQVVAQGKKLYETHCVDCHGADGKGLAPAYPPLAGNRAIAMDNSVNAVRIVLNVGFAPRTIANPQPYGMPPYSHVRDDYEVAAVVSSRRRGSSPH